MSNSVQKRIIKFGKDVFEDTCLCLKFFGHLVPVFIILFGSLLIHVPMIKNTLIMDFVSRPNFDSTFWFFVYWQVISAYSLALTLASIKYRNYDNEIILIYRPIFLFTSIAPSISLFLFILYNAHMSLQLARVESGVFLPDITNDWSWMIDRENGVGFLFRLMFAVAYSDNDPNSEDSWLGLNQHQFTLLFSAAFVVFIIICSFFYLNISKTKIEGALNNRKYARYAYQINFVIGFIVTGTLIWGLYHSFYNKITPSSMLFFGLGTWTYLIVLFPLLLIRREKFGGLINPYVVSLLIAGSAVYAFWTKSPAEHVRQATLERMQNLKGEQPSLGGHLQTWLNNRYGSTTELPKNIPMIFVSSGGGGLRAAVWTAGILADLTENSQSFSKHLWSISGVSGGAIGAAAFLASTSGENYSQDGQRTCRKINQVNAELEEMHFTECLFEFFQSNTVGPIINSALTQDSVPLWGTTGRTQALLNAWDENWRHTMNDNSLFVDWHSLKHHHYSTPPVLLMNSTTVEHGKRLIFSNVDLDASNFDAHFMGGQFHLGIQSLGAAAGLSALFPFVSNEYPVFLKCKFYKRDDEKEKCSDGDKTLSEKLVLWAHATDGGYFDNFGARSTQNLIEATAVELKKLAPNSTLVPIVLQISSNPDLSSTVNDYSSASSISESSTTFLNALYAAMNTHETVGFLHYQTLENAVRQEHGGLIYHVDLCPNALPEAAPTSWNLSKNVIQYLLFGTGLNNCTSSAIKLNKMKKDMDSYKDGLSPFVQ